MEPILQNGRAERIRAYGGILLSVMIVIAILALVFWPNAGDLGTALAGGLTMALKDTVTLFDRATKKEVVL